LTTPEHGGVGRAVEWGGVKRRARGVGALAKIGGRRAKDVVSAIPLPLVGGVAWTRSAPGCIVTENTRVLPDDAKRTEAIIGRIPAARNPRVLPSLRTPSAVDQAGEKSLVWSACAWAN
jgi:hypothetical protein